MQMITIDAQKTGKGLRALLMFLLFFVAVVVFAYFYHFGGMESNFSRQASDWGAFGDYLSGVLGSIFSFAAFLGVVWTIHLQAKQLQLQRGQIAVEEMQRFIFSSSEKIDDLLHQGFFDGFKDSRINGKMTLFDCIAAAGTLKMRLDDPNLQTNESDQYLLHQFNSASSNLINRMLIEFNSLAWAIDKHQARGGDKEIFGFYVQKYIALLYWLHKLDKIDEGTSTYKTFSFAFPSVDGAMR